ncbi:ABC transporter substrate-binding protein [Arcanobacterium ihumii]|uniref:ABC transporter substrate-binding protein n=1 Tax=Arcanobacterium ihumii TaxID=2138162 RepID=UPI000F535E76|nr:sugar ABC transporter substrate-binding protein [Arcanobacterium ihumii]
MKRSLIKVFALCAAATVGLAACSPADSGKKSSGDGAKATVTFRLWDNTAAPAYEKSFAEFKKQNKDIDVKVEVVPWDSYWKQLPLDVSAGQAPDIYWVNSSNFALYADAGNIMDISKELGDKHDRWQESVVDLYTRNGKLWGVPQLWDSIALFYNKDLVKEASVDPTKLTWMPQAGTGDTLLAATKSLTKDTQGRDANDPHFDANSTKVFGFNAQADLQAIWLDFLAQNGGKLQDDDDKLSIATPQGEAAFSYVVDMINKHHVAPPASETNTKGDVTRDMFVRGELALYQSGPYSLKNIAEAAKINWGLAPMVAGPEGRVGVVHGVAAVGNEKSKNRDATIKVLSWLGSADGQRALGTEGVAFPAVKDVQKEFVTYWDKKGVDVSTFIDAASGKTTPAPRGVGINVAFDAFVPALLDVFNSSIPVGEGLKKAQDAGNAAMK